MKFLILSALLAVAFAQNPHPLSKDHDTQIVREEIVNPVGAVYRFLYELSNGIAAEETGAEGSEGQAVVTGRYFYRTPEGYDVEVIYTADEGGYRPQSDALPVDHPLPEHVQELLRIAEEQRAQGIKFNEQGFRI